MSNCSGVRKSIKLIRRTTSFLQNQNICFDIIRVSLWDRNLFWKQKQSKIAALLVFDARKLTICHFFNNLWIKTHMWSECKAIVILFVFEYIVWKRMSHQQKWLYNQSTNHFGVVSYVIGKFWTLVAFKSNLTANSKNTYSSE